MLHTVRPLIETGLWGVVHAFGAPDEVGMMPIDCLPSFCYDMFECLVSCRYDISHMSCIMEGNTCLSLEG